MTDEQLVERARGGSDATFEPLYRKHASYVRWLVGKLLDSPEDADDCCQEVWLKVRRGLDTYQGTAGFRAWLGTVAANQARDMVRKDIRLRRALTAALEVYRYERQRTQEAFDAQQHGSLVQALDALDELQRRVVEERLRDPKVTLEELGAILDLPRHKVKYAWSAALEKLRQRLTEWGATEGMLALCPLALAGLAALWGGGARG